eukprot:Seg363.12 transcript_id=Seg363.12/GoldUCD/mRNA.D3Y31 product="U3 small nucleolar RNA-interacting protein 2" protein_id=Seg363.12/GoldUCD/D3Y31
MPGFFLKGKAAAKSKKPKVGGKRKAQAVKAAHNEDLDSDSDVISGDDKGNNDVESDDSIEETAQEKRLRLAKDYIAKLEEEERLKAIATEVDRDAIAHRLQEDVLNEQGILQRTVAGQFSGYDKDNIKILKGHQLSVTCLVISQDGNFVYSGSKDGSIIKWCLKSGKKEFKILGDRKSKSKDEQGSAKGHKGDVLCLAASTDGKYLASGGKEKGINVWNATDLTFIRTFNGHKSSVTGLAFRKGTNQLFSASMDRSIKVWNLDEMTYIETLFGHEDGITGIDSLAKDRAVTCGGRDRTVRLWKIPEESQLVFRAHNTPSIDCVAMINEEYFVSGADDGSLSIWNVHKKKPLTTIRNAHKIHKTQQSEDIDCNESWVTSVATLTNSDLVASGSCDSCIRLWKCDKGYRSLHPLFTIPVDGFVNSLAFSNSGDCIIAGIGQEHRLGRWWRFKNAKNSIQVIPLLKESSEE